MTKLRFAVIGTGHISSTHIDAIRNCENAELAAIMSHDNTRAEMFAGKYNVKAYSDIDELLADNEIDIVDIVSYHDLHVEYALKAVKNKKHVIIEKPIGIHIEHIDELIEEAKKNNVKVTVISQHRLDEAFIRAKSRIEAGELGKILFVNVDLIQNRSENYYMASPWRTQLEKAGGGVLMMNAVHLIDVLLWMLGDVKSVYGKIENIKHKIDVEDTASALIKFKNNAVVSLHASNSASYNHPFRVMIYGEKKSLMIEYGKVIEINNQKNTNMLTRLKNAAVRRLPVRMSKSRMYKTGSIAEQINIFADSIVNNKENSLATALDGKKALEVILAVYKSSKSGREININR